MTAPAITHAKVATLPDQPGVEVNKGEWNANHALANFSGVSKLLGSGSAAATADEITLGTNLSMSGTTLNSTAANSGPTYPGGIPLTGVVYPAAYNTNLVISGSGHNDIYTVPTNKRALIIGYTLRNDTGGNVSHYVEVKISGTYYRLTNTANPATGGQATSQIAYIAEAGEIVGINCATTAGAVATIGVIEFDSSCNFYSPKLTSLSVGDNTVYTAPSGRNGILMSNLVPTTIPAFSNNTNQPGNFYVNSSGGARTVSWKFTPSGGSAVIVSGSTAVSDVNRSAVSAAVFGMTNGDKLIINTDAGTATQMAWVNVMEI